MVREPVREKRHMLLCLHVHRKKSYEMSVPPQSVRGAAFITSRREQDEMNISLQMLQNKRTVVATREHEQV